MRTTRPASGYEFRTIVRVGLGIASVAAGVIHLTAASAHSEHAPILAFFVATGIAQIVFGTAVLPPSPPRLVLRVGALANAGLIAVWLASRLSGLPFVDGADHVEPVGVKDTATVALQLLAIVAALVLVADPRLLAARVRLTDRALAPLAVATALVIVPGIVAPAHVHTDAHHHDADASHAHEGAELAASHAHAASEARHAHASAGEAHAHADAVAGHAETHEHATPTRTSGDHRVTPAFATGHSMHHPPEVAGTKATVRYGPFMMPPASMGGEAHYNRILQNVTKPCSDCYILQIRPDLQYADGTSANIASGAMLHHAVWTRPAYSDMTCGRNSAIGSQGLRFFAAGNERTVFALPEGYGYHVGADSWTLIAEIMNHSDRPQTLYVTLDVIYRPASDNLKRITPVWLDVDNCGDSQYAVPAGKSSQLWTWNSTVTGRVVSTAGHVHDGGVKTVLSNESTKRQMCTSVAGYGTKPEFAGTIESMSMCVWDRIGVVRKGEVLGLRAFYDSSQAADDVMGIMIAAVYETTDLAGGTEPPRDGAPQDQKPPPSHDHGDH